MHDLEKIAIEDIVNAEGSAPVVRFLIELLDRREKADGAQPYEIKEFRTAKASLEAAAKVLEILAI